MEKIICILQYSVRTLIKKLKCLFPTECISDKYGDRKEGRERKVIHDEKRIVLFTLPWQWALMEESRRTVYRVSSWTCMWVSLRLARGCLVCSSSEGHGRPCRMSCRDGFGGDPTRQQTREDHGIGTGPPSCSPSSPCMRTWASWGLWGGTPRVGRMLECLKW